MAKGKARPVVSVSPLATFASVDKFFISTTGMKIPLKPISQFKLDAMRTSRKEIPVPTYEADLPGGDKEVLPLDEISAKNQGREEEWKQYLSNVEAEKNEFGTRFNDMVVYEGVDLDAPGAGSDWEEKCKMFGLIIPANPIKRKIFYINNELLGTPEDIGDLVTAIYAASKFAPEVIAKMKATFRSAMEEQKNKRVAKGEVPVADQ